MIHPFFVYEKLLAPASEEQAGKIIERCRAIIEKSPKFAETLRMHHNIADTALQGNINADALLLADWLELQDTEQGLWKLVQRLAEIMPECRKPVRPVFLETPDTDPYSAEYAIKSFNVPENVVIMGVQQMQAYPTEPIKPKELYAYLRS